MAKVYSDRIYVSIDVGTTKICVLIAQHLHDNQIEILGIGRVPSAGLRKGVVVDVAKTIHSIKAAIKEAELMAGMQIESAYIGISGGHISSVNSQGMVPIAKGEVRETDIANVLAAAKAIPVPEGQQILHVLPQYFVIDGQEKIHDPLGMHGIRLEVQAHIILGAIASVQNLVKCCEMAGVKVNDIILEQLASADAVLSDDEKELGIAVLDIGGGTSDFAVYQHGSIRHTKVIPVAGNHFTNDLAIGLRITLADAERIKREQGGAMLAAEENNAIIEVEMVQGSKKNSVQLHEVVSILKPRAQEIMALVHDEILKYHLQPFMRTGLVLTGGGSLLKGFKEIAEDIVKIPIRFGSPRVLYDIPESLENPIYATGYGLLLHTIKKEQKALMNTMNGPLVTRIVSRMKSWVADFF